MQCVNRLEAIFVIACYGIHVKLQYMICTLLELDFFLLQSIKMKKEKSTDISILQAKVHES